MKKKRVIFYVGGYDPQSKEKFFEHFGRQVEKFKNVWDTNVKASEIKEHGNHISSRTFVATGSAASDKKWEVETQFYFLASDDVVRGDYHKSFIYRVWRYIIAALNYIVSGTTMKFLKTSWRYHTYFFYPFVVLLTTVLVSLFLAGRIANLWLAPPLFIMIFWAIKKSIWDRYYIMKAMETWTFSIAYIYRKRPDLEERINGLAKCMTQVIENEEFDEMLLIGHSLGGAFLIDSAWQAINALEKAKDKNIVFFTIGSTILKVGLHPKAQWFRQKTDELFNKTNLAWVEYQSHMDIISFCKVNAAKLMGLNINNDEQNNQRPMIRGVRFRSMLDNKKYKKIRFKLFRMHYQFTYASYQKYHYDFPAICLGPAELIKRANNKEKFLNNLLGN